MPDDAADPTNEGTARRWQAEIVKLATERLGRPLSEPELAFITSRLGFIALEVIQDTVKAASASELEEYLNSEVTR